MIHGDVEFHGFEEIVESVESGWVQPQRVPESVRVHLNPGAQQKVLDPAGGEIRFVTTDHRAKITLSSASWTSFPKRTIA